MRFKTARTSESPTVDLVPMMDVLMSILTFFIIISMTLTGQQVLNVNLPESKSAAVSDPNQVGPTLVIGMNPKGQLLIDNQVVNEGQLEKDMLNFLEKQPEGIIVLNADRKLDYRQVVEVMRIMQAVGGDRVSLAINQ